MWHPTILSDSGVQTRELSVSELWISRWSHPSLQKDNGDTLEKV
jgi:hypothetical protein